MRWPRAVLAVAIVAGVAAVCVRHSATVAELMGDNVESTYGVTAGGALVALAIWAGAHLYGWVTDRR